MATILNNLSSYNKEHIPDATGMKIGIVVSEWNSEVTNALLSGAMKILTFHGVKKKDLIVKFVPGSFELPLAASQIIRFTRVQAVICLGCIIQGETRHFEFISQGVANGIMNLNLKYNKPVIFGVLTTLNLEQALERSGGKHGNKGDEAAITAIKMIELKRNIKNFP